MRGRPYSDAELLEILDERADGISPTVTARRLGMSRSAMAGLHNRMRGDTDDPNWSNGDGTMSPEWVQAGLQRQMARVLAE